MFNNKPEDKTDIPPHLLARLSEVISSNIGLNFPENRWPDLNRNILIMERELRLGNATACAQWLLDEAKEQEREDLFIRYLTIGETSFFRDKVVWHLLKTRIIPERIKSQTHGRRMLNFWSAACSSGEEPYSIAMTVSQVPALKNWKINILATDINNIALEKGKSGIFSTWSFRNTKPWFLANYFRKINENSFAISPAIQSMVTFRQLNLALNKYPSVVNHTADMDVIFCRNVLMYFPHDLRNTIISRLARSLKPGGWLLLAASEVGFADEAALQGENIDGVFVFRKHIKTEIVHEKAENPQIPTFLDLSGCKYSPFVKQPETLVVDFKTPKVHARQSEKKPSLEVQFKEAHDLYRAGYYAESREILQKILDTKERLNDNYSLQAKALKLLAKAYANEGQLEMARTYGEQAMGKERFNPMHYYFLATVCLEQGEEEEAITFLKKSLYLDDTFVLAYFLLANLVNNETEKKKHLQNTLSLLHDVDSEKILIGSDGQTAGWVRETASNMLERLKNR